MWMYLSNLRSTCQIGGYERGGEVVGGGNNDGKRYDVEHGKEKDNEDTSNVVKSLFGFSSV